MTLKSKTSCDASGRPLEFDEGNWGGSQVLILDGPNALREGKVKALVGPIAEVDICDRTESFSYSLKQERVAVKVRDLLIVTGSSAGQWTIPTPRQLADVIIIGRDALSPTARRKLVLAWGKAYAEHEDQAQTQLQVREEKLAKERAKARVQFAEDRTKQPVQELNARIQRAAQTAPDGYAGEFRASGRVVETEPMHRGRGTVLTNRDFSAFTVVARLGNYSTVFAICGDHKTAFATFSQGDARERHAARNMWCPECASIATD